MTDPNPVYRDTCAAIDRFLAGDYNATQLRSWLLVHFDPDQADKAANHLWSATMSLLAVYAVGDFERADLAESIRMLRTSDDPALILMQTPLFQDAAFRDIMFSGNPPWPLQRLVTNDELAAQREREGFREI